METSVCTLAEVTVHITSPLVALINLLYDLFTLEMSFSLLFSAMVAGKTHKKAMNYQ
jgi:hypothetical protein